MVPDKLRQPLALVVLFGGMFALYLVYDLFGLGIAAFGFFLCFAVIGIASGYWVGFDGRIDQAVAAMIKRFKERQAAEDDRQA